MRVRSTISCMRIDVPSALMLFACPVRLYAPGVRRCDAVGLGPCVQVREFATVYVRSDI